ncbi:CinA family protein [Methylovulum psychrotolerans]|uniref:CinA family protein n=1 Tax=Methylovulum psychrotolerans TaxID=1704499 RepID=UPI001BFF343A|nr:CinA family protein [Methylovulum psychrotolerans]MBT9096524.1 CinA family protein [Methylovulum psychrotolerans]
MDEGQLEVLAVRLGAYLTERGQSIATAESCTGGWLAQVITAIPGSSAWFERGFVTYSNDAKVEMLGVDPQIIGRYGAVSEETVTAMVAGALARSRASCAIAVTGVAGPAGGTPAKPVGTVFIAWLEKGGVPLVARQQFSGDRHQIRAQSVQTALEGAMR